ncbi:MAG: hypothetical protein DRG20_07235 [Deltaproteobacteria bacterium]|nr:MAG: hypothetical protein DRG20_07235 [Deltaproteobacteria bacterium]
MKSIVKYPLLKLLAVVGERISSFFTKGLNLDSVQKILIFAGSGGIGDMLCILPVIRAIGKHFPSAHISILCRYKSEFFFYFPESKYISNYILFDVRTHHKSFLSKIKLIQTLRQKNFDLVYDPARGEGMMEHSIIMFLSDIPYRIGFEKDGCGFLYNVKRKFLPDVPILKQNLLLLEQIGIHSTDTTIHIYLSKKDIEFVNHIILKNKKPFFVVIHPGATWHAKYRSWPIKNFVEIAKRIISNYGIKVVILGRKEDKISNKIFTSLKSPFIIDIVGKTTLGQMMAIIKHSHLFIGNDSGPLHIARAFKIPSIGIFGPTSPKQVISDWENFIPVQKKLPCVPCYLHQPFFKPKCKKPLCLTSLSVDEVWTAVETMLKKVMLN